jgi:hypothetical protein
MKQSDRELTELSIERIKQLLGTKKISDESIKKVMDKIKRFCKVAYQLYLKKSKPSQYSEIVNIESGIEAKETIKEKQNKNQPFKKVA